MSRSKYGYDRDNRSPPRYYDRDDDGRQDTSEGRHSDEEDSVKPYTAVGATLDSAQRFKRRMNYGRANPRVEEKENSDRNDGREPGYMRTTEAYSKRSSRSKSPDLRQKYPHWYEDDRDNERNDSARGRSPDQGDRYGRQESPKKYGMGFPSRRRNSEPREQYSRDRFSPGAKERFSPRRKSADRESIYNQSLDRDRRSPERNQKSRGRFSPDQYKRSPERNGSDYYRRRSPERVPTGKDDYSRRSPERREESPKKEERKYGRSSSAESFQTVKIKKSDLNEIRRKYELKLKQNVIESAKSQAYRYSSNMRNSSEPSSSDGKQSKPSTSSFSRSKSESRDKVRKKREWRVFIKLTIVNVLMKCFLILES